MAHVSIPSYWKTLPQRYCLIGMKCKNCGTINLPAREICISCRQKAEFEPRKLSGRGTIYSYTIIAAGSAPPEFSDQEKLAGSFPVAIVKLEEDLRIVAQITDYEEEDLKIGAEVEAVFRKIYEEDKVVRYGLKFRPAKKRKPPS